MLDKSELDEEFIKEIASVGGGYGAKIELCMREMERISRAVAYLKVRIEREAKPSLFSMRLMVRLRKRFFYLREKAIEQRKYLIIYREALGLLRHREVFEVYNIESIEL
ncbi:MAG: hypothetical protein GXO18_05015 [Aquificae bacterium]|nr:hypothetical protein [Aquificota bacterium]